MNRCNSTAFPPSRSRATLTALVAAALIALMALLPLASVQAQVIEQPVRAFPPSALRGTLLVVSPPDIRIDGRVERLSPGARIRGPENHMVMSGALVGQPVLVNFTREPQGLIHEIWILNEAEAREKRTLATPTRNFLFGSEGDTGPRDDGKTPYNQLPGYGTPTR